MLICRGKPTGPMKRDAAEAGFYTSPWGEKHAKIQILTLEDLIDGKGIDYPKLSANVSLPQAQKVTKKDGIEQLVLLH